MSQIQIHVKMFASFAEACGFREKQMTVPVGSTPCSLFRSIIEQYPELRNYEDTMLVAVNASHTSTNTELKDGDEVAFFPPVSGG